MYKARRDCLVAALRNNFDAPVIEGFESGLHLVWRLPQGLPNARKIQSLARERGIGVYALSSGAAYDFDAEARDDALVFGYSSLDVVQINEAAQELRSILNANLD